mmetsp:Transcript_113257/g.283657  ORF Transcript_113257/g.283657 Transcript_113257/m.283657 type:complete len:350 (-) Transcript_113257:1336-2385(-)
MLFRFLAELLHVPLARALRRRVVLDLGHPLPGLPPQAGLASRILHLLQILEQAGDHGAVAEEVLAVRLLHFHRTKLLRLGLAESRHARVHMELAVLQPRVALHHRRARLRHLLGARLRVLQALPDAAVAHLHVRAQLLDGGPASRHGLGVRADVGAHDDLRLELSPGTGRGELLLVLHEASVDPPCAGWNVRAEGLDVGDAGVVDLRREHDVGGALPCEADDRALAGRVFDLGHVVPEAHQHLPASFDHLVLAERGHVRLAVLGDTVLQPVVVVVGLQVVLDVVLAAGGERDLLHVVVQALQDLRLPNGHVLAEHRDGGLASVQQQRLQGDGLRFQGSLQDLHFLAALL